MEIRRLMRGVHRALEELGVRYWIIGGTLLGGVRDGCVVPWDDDTDIEVFYEEWMAATKDYKLEKTLKEHGMYGGWAVLGEHLMTCRHV